MSKSKSTETKVTFEDCRRFQIDPTRNPLTGRTIKVGGPIYNKLVAACKQLNLQALPSSTPTSILPLPQSKPSTPATPAPPVTRTTTPSTPITLQIPKLPQTPTYTPRPVGNIPSIPRATQPFSQPFNTSPVPITTFRGAPQPLSPLQPYRSPQLQLRPIRPLQQGPTRETPVLVPEPLPEEEPFPEEEEPGEEPEQGAEQEPAEGTLPVNLDDLTIRELSDLAKIYNIPVDMTRQSYSTKKKQLIALLQVKLKPFIISTGPIPGAEPAPGPAPGPGAQPAPAPRVIRTGIPATTTINLILPSAFGESFEALPYNVKLRIAQQLSVGMLRILCRSSRAWTALCVDDNLWKLLYERDFRSAPDAWRISSSGANSNNVWYWNYRVTDETLNFLSELFEELYRVLLVPGVRTRRGQSPEDASWVTQERINAKDTLPIEEAFIDLQNWLKGYLEALDPTVRELLPLKADIELIGQLYTLSYEAKDTARLGQLQDDFLDYIESVATNSDNPQENMARLQDTFPNTFNE